VTASTALSHPLFPLSTLALWLDNDFMIRSDVIGPGSSRFGSCDSGCQRHHARTDDKYATNDPSKLRPKLRCCDHAKRETIELQTLRARRKCKEQRKGRVLQTGRVSVRRNQTLTGTSEPSNQLSYGSPCAAPTPHIGRSCEHYAAQVPAVVMNYL
jgi:hypothetical protein